MGEDLDALFVKLGESLVDNLRRENRRAAPVLFASGSGGQQGLAPEGGFALRRTVEHELDPLQLQPVLILAEGFVGGIGRLHLAALEAGEIFPDQRRDLQHQGQ